MNSNKNMLMVALAIVVFLLVQAWYRDYPVVVPEKQPVQQAQAAEESDIPVVGQQAQQVEKMKASHQVAPIRQRAPDSRLIHVRTDVVDVTIDKLGGAVTSVKLLHYPITKGAPDKPFILLNDAPETLYVAQSGLTGKRGPDTPEKLALYESDKNDYVLGEDEDALPVELSWRGSDGVFVKKVFLFKRNDYEVHMAYDIENKSSQPWQGHLFTQIKRKELPKRKAGIGRFATYFGGALSSADKHYEKVTFKSMAKEDIDRQVQGGWLAMIQHYFVSAWVPASQQLNHYYSHSNEATKTYILGAYGPQITVPAGEDKMVSAQFYAGPGVTDRLEQVAPYLELTIDYGKLWLISEAIFWMMKHIYAIVGNWGWAIVFVTCLIKLAFYKLSAKSYRSMAAMRKLQPRIQAMKERFGDDKRQMQEAMMRLYKEEKVNPFGGCLPILIQIPVFIALYWVLVESVELRHAPFILWIQDLSQKDPYYVLPLLMGASMFIQQKLNPPPPDPMQAKMMMMFPVVFTVLFLNFPSGLVLYWFVNNTLGILQQWHITRKIVSNPKS